MLEMGINFVWLIFDVFEGTEDVIFNLIKLTLIEP